jgi:3'-phosphoadenosine 5'-phosphosulfate sulfotransferase (PAPS reductase)/FAD synthetase
MKRPQHIINVSGGKDSTAVYLLAMESERPFRAIHCDTGHEHPVTEEYVRTLHERTGGPEVEIVRADFSKGFARKRAYILAHWEADGVPADRVRRVAELLEKPTGIPFLDLCMMKGRFPSTRARFCTEELKVLPAMRQVALPAAQKSPVLRWVGVRADESQARARAKPLERDDHRRIWIWRPILRWTVEDVFAMHRKHGVEPNPLYKQGMGRVGCMPCIMARKAEIAEISRRWPEQFERVAEWERLVAETSKQGRATLFAADKTRDAPVDGVYPGISAVGDWSKTSHGGEQYDLQHFMPAPSCSSLYGLCE